MRARIIASRFGHAVADASWGNAGLLRDMRRSGCHGARVVRPFAVLVQRILARAVRGYFRRVFRLVRSDEEKDPDALWPMFTFVLSVGLFGFSSFFFIDTFVAGQFMRASADCIIVFAWVVVACVVYRKKLQPIFFISVFQSLSIQTRLRFRKPPLMLCFRRLILVPAAWLLLRSHLLWRLPLSGAPSFFPQ